MRLSKVELCVSVIWVMAPWLHMLVVGNLLNLQVGVWAKGVWVEVVWVRGVRHW